MITEELGNGKNENDPYIYIHSYSSDAMTMMKFLTSYDKTIIGFSHVLAKVRKYLMVA